MSVLVKDMAMPKNCSECRFCAWKDGNDVGCAATGKGADDCPLIPIPDHGDLIDKNRMIDILHYGIECASAVQKGAEDEKDISYCQGVMAGYGNSIVALDALPIIIPAERSGE